MGQCPLKTQAAIFSCILEANLTYIIVWKAPDIIFIQLLGKQLSTKPVVRIFDIFGNDRQLNIRHN